MQPTNIAQVYSILPNLVTHNFEENYGFTSVYKSKSSQVTADSEIFARILFSRIALKDILVMEKKLRLRQDLPTMYINKRQSDFAISRGLYFHETSHSFAKIKSSRTFPNLQYCVFVLSEYKCCSCAL